jgi:hypothetical protein
MITKKCWTEVSKEGTTLVCWGYFFLGIPVYVEKRMCTIMDILWEACKKGASK